MPGLKILQGGGKDNGAVQASDNAVGRLVAVTRYSDDDRLDSGNADLLYKLPAARESGAGGRLCKESFGFRKKVYRLEDLLVRVRLSPAPGGPYAVENIGAVGRVSDCN